jgi:hypothetical protein
VPELDNSTAGHADGGWVGQAFYNLLQYKLQCTFLKMVKVIVILIITNMVDVLSMYK